MKVRISCCCLSVSLILLLASCSNRGFTKPRAVIDLSPTMGEGFVRQTLGQKLAQRWGRDVVIENAGVEEPFYVAVSYVTLATHVGPHHDPPNHIIKEAESTDQVSLRKFFGKARVFDFRDKPKDEPLLAADFANQGIEAGEIVIAMVGYTPPTEPDELPSYAYLSEDAAEYLATIPVRAFASDMPSIGSIRLAMARVQRGEFPGLGEHHAFLSRNIPNIEGLTNLEAIVNEGNVVFVGFPLKIENGNGGPMRAVAFVY